MPGHIIVVGDDKLARRIIEELNDAELSVVPVQTADDLHTAGVLDANAVICAATDDAVNLESALRARLLNPDVRVVARLSNTVLREALADTNGPGAILDVADLAAPSVAEALLDRTSHTVAVAGRDFIVSRNAAPRDSTVRELYGRLAPVAVLRGENSPNPGEVIACPSRDTEVYRGDWTTVIGTEEELAAQGVPIPAPIKVKTRHRSLPVRAFDSVRALHRDVNPMFYRALAIAATLLLGSAVLLRYHYQRQPLSWTDALYFSAETISTVGFGDFNFLHEPAWLKLWAVVMMLTGVATTAFVVAFAADVLLSRRMLQSAGLQKASHMRRHHVLVGLGAFGIRVANLLRDAGHDVVVIERNEENRYIGAAREAGVTLVFGDATMPETLQAAQLRRARAFSVLTEDDMVNIETALVAREVLGPGQTPHNQRVPIVMRIHDRALGRAVGQRLGFNYVRSTVDLATPWFMGAALGLDVLGTFSVGQTSFMAGGGEVLPGSELDGLHMAELSTHTRVIAIRHPDGELRLHPKRDTALAAGDTVYLVGPFRELLGTMLMGQRPARTARARSVSRWPVIPSRRVSARSSNASRKLSA